MALQTTLDAGKNPFEPAELAGAYSKVVFFAVDDHSKTARAVLNVYRSQAAREANKQPIRQEQIVIQAQPVEEQRDERGNVTQPRVPSYDEVMADHNALFDGVKAALYGLTKQAHPLYTAATDV